MDSEEKYSDIRNKLQNLEQVKASDNFVHNLHHKIVEFESEKRKQHAKKYDEGLGGFLRNLFANRQYPWLIPAAGFTVLIFFVFYITFLNKNASEKNEQLLSTNKQESTEQKNGITQKEQTETKEPPVVTSEPEKQLTDKGKISEKDIASDLKTDKNPTPVETERKATDREAPKIYKEESKATDKNEPEVTYDGKAMEQTAPESKIEPETKKERVSSTQPKDENAKADTDMMSKGILKTDDPGNKRLREKIDSVSKVDLEKLRELILK